jgi:hypothetical protein
MLRASTSTPSGINRGWCYLWACVVKRYRPEADLVVVKGNKGNGHVFIRLGDKYYDSECLRGRKDWKKLNYFKRSDFDLGDSFYKVVTEEEALKLLGDGDDTGNILLVMGVLEGDLDKVQSLIGCSLM